MYEEKKYTKTKIFLFLLFGILVVFLLASVADFMINMFSEIDKKSIEFRCADIDYSLQNIIYKNNVLTFLLENKDYGMNFSMITIIPDASEKNFTIGLDSPLIGGSSRVISITNITITSNFDTFIQNCEYNRRKNRI